MSLSTNLGISMIGTDFKIIDFSYSNFLSAEEAGDGTSPEIYFPSYLNCTPTKLLKLDTLSKQTSSHDKMFFFSDR